MEQPGADPPAVEVDAAQPLLPSATDSPAEDNPEPAGGSRRKRIRPSTKAIWILTYGASGPYITAQMLLELGNIHADECHTTMDRVMKYTYIHLCHWVQSF